MKLFTAVLTLNDHHAHVGGWELLAAGKMLTGILLPLHHYLCIFSILILACFCILYFYALVLLKMLHNLWCEITNLKNEVVKRLGAIEFDQGVSQVFIYY